MTYVVRTGPYVPNLGNFDTLAELLATHPASLYNPGTTAYTTDQGIVVTNGSTWEDVGTGGSFALTAATYAAARAISGVTTGDRLEVLGRTALSDGGQGLFTWVAGGSTTINDGVELTASGGIWRRTKDQRVTPLMFGAVGDGVTDDTAAIQATLNACGALGRDCWFPGDYAITADVTVPVGTPQLQAGGSPWAVNLRGEGREKSRIKFVGSGFTNGLYWSGSAAYRLAGSVRDICFFGGSPAVAPQGLTFRNCDMPLVERCWIDNFTGRGVFFDTCIMPMLFTTYITGCASASFGQVEVLNCTTFRWFMSYISGANASPLGGLLIDKTAEFTVDGGAIESTGTPILIASQANTTGCSSGKICHIDLENPGNNNRYIDIGAGLSGGATVQSLTLDNWNGSPSGTTTIPSAVRIQNGNGCVFNTANIALAGTPTAMYELAGTANLKTRILPHTALHGGTVPWVFVNGAQVNAAGPLMDWQQGSSGVVPIGYSSLQTTLNGATPSILINAQGGYYRQFASNNGGATTVTSLSGGERGMEIVWWAFDANTTLTHSTVTAGAFNLIGGVNLLLTAGRMYRFIHNGTVWVQM